jgi:hypothetical protein
MYEIKEAFKINGKNGRIVRVASTKGSKKMADTKDQGKNLQEVGAEQEKDDVKA